MVRKIQSHNFCPLCIVCLLNMRIAMLASVLFFHYRIFSNYFSSFVDGLGFHVMFTACRICREIIISIMFVRNTARAGGVLVTVVIVLCIFRAVNANNRKIPYGTAHTFFSFAFRIDYDYAYEWKVCRYLIAMNSTIAWEYLIPTIKLLLVFYWIGTF